MNKLIALLLNRAFVSALLIIAGSILTAIYGKDFGVDEKLTETILTVVGGIATAFGYVGALTAPTSEKK
jgi:uncharacterized membrane protein